MKELQTALGLVAAEDGICIVPTSVNMMGRPDIVFRELVQHAVSPIIVSHRKRDDSPNLAVMMKVIAKLYGQWGWPLPSSVARRFAQP